ncbi:unnamed protein product [Auanema sp. JU1783]|nr:unnamed protein product [Auanema sp. JU1783]
MLFILFLLALCAAQSSADGFVEEVICSAQSLTVMLNRSDPDVARWVADPKSQPVVYVYDHKKRRECGNSMRNEHGQLNFNLTIPYGTDCDVILADVEPNYRTAETTIALEDNVDVSISKTLRINHVFCIYTRNVKTIRFNDVSNGHEVVASTGGKPKPRVEMVFRSTDGRPLRAAKFGDTVEFYIALSPDQAYHGIAPKECMFSDREDVTSPEAKHITFVQNSCPVVEMSEIIDPLANVNQEVYFSKFKTFRFGNQSTVFAHCTVQVCLDAKECNQNCFKRIQNSNLTAERLRFRHKRDIPSTAGSMKDDLYNEIAVTRTLTILDNEETREVASRSTEQCVAANAVTPTVIFLIIGALTVCTLASITTAVYLGCKRKTGKKNSFDLYSAFAAPTA